MAADGSRALVIKIEAAIKFWQLSAQGGLGLLAAKSLAK